MKEVEDSAELDVSLDNVRAEIEDLAYFFLLLFFPHWP